MATNVIKWIKESNRWKHLAGGVAIGLGAEDVYCAAYAGVGVAAAMELKDRQWGGQWDWIDFGLTVAGVAVGYGIRCIISGQVRLT